MDIGRVRPSHLAVAAMTGNSVENQRTNRRDEVMIRDENILKNIVYAAIEYLEGEIKLNMEQLSGLATSDEPPPFRPPGYNRKFDRLIYWAEKCSDFLDRRIVIIKPDSKSWYDDFNTNLASRALYRFEEEIEDTFKKLEYYHNMPKEQWKKLPFEEHEMQYSCECHLEHLEEVFGTDKLEDIFEAIDYLVECRFRFDTGLRRRVVS